jgi:GT2 family glycosyltransferase
MDVPAVSVVVATRNRAGRLAALLDSLSAQTLHHFEVVVVDDGSTDGTHELLAGRSGVRTLRHERPLGPSAARNTGWRAARAPLVAFTDDDCVASPRWLEELVAAAQAGTVVQGPVEPIAAERARLGPFSRSLWVERLGPWYQAANVLYPRELLERLGGFDAGAFPFAGEDCDLAWRAIAAGAQPVWAPGARVEHAVNLLGPAGSLRVALRWSELPPLFRRHPALRDQALTHRIFWKGSHYLLVRALIGLALPRRLALLRLWLAAPYARHLLNRGRHDGGGPLAAPWYALHDLVELAAIARGAARSRTLVL